MKTNLILLFILTSLVLSSCSNNKSATDLFKDGESYSGEQKYSDAVASYETLLNEYPDDKFAPDAAARLASIYQNKLVPTISETESLHKSVELFKSIHQKYPDSGQAPTGLFMAGFVEANELKDFDAATNTYNLFLEIYPDHELVVSAKEELENMGLSPEEILQKNLNRQ